MKRNNKLEKAIHKIRRHEHLWTPVGHPDDGYSANFGIENTVEDQHFYVAFHQDDMPAHARESFDTIEALAEYMLRLQPDLRRWRFAD